MKIPPDGAHLKDLTTAFDAVPEQTILLATSALLEAFERHGEFEFNLSLRRGGFLDGRVEATTHVRVHHVEMSFRQIGSGDWPRELALIATPQMLRPC